MTPTDPSPANPPTNEKEEQLLKSVARAISRDIEGLEMYWQDYMSAAGAAIDAYKREN